MKATPLGKAAKAEPPPRRPRPGTNRLADHIQELCIRHGIVRVEAGDLRARAERHRRRGDDGGRQPVRLVRIPPVTTELRYLIALHEIAHHIGPGRSGRRLEQEEAAWRWAFANSLIEPSQTTRQRCGRRLRSYASWAELRQHRRRPPYLPSKEASFWRLLRWMEA